MSKCIVCGRKLREKDIILKIGNMPARAQRFWEGDTNGIDLSLCQCPMCGLIQFDCEPVEYYKEVIRAGGLSSTMKDLRQAQYSRFIELCDLKGKSIIEVGCGQGEFLEVFEGFPVVACGIEYNEDLVQRAKKKGLHISKNFAENENTILSGAPYDAFTSFNFLEHQPNPNGMLQAIYENLTEDGVGLITVPSFEYIMDNDGFYELIRDHLAYYTFETLEFLLNKNGFLVLEREMVNRDTLSVIVKKRRKLNVDNLKCNHERVSIQVNDYVNSYIKDGKQVALWGASHQGFTIASTTNLKEKVSYIIDSADFKQGKLSPASQLPIVAPDYYYENPVDAIIIVAPGYTKEIKEIIRNKFGGKVDIAVLKSDVLEICKGN